MAALINSSIYAQAPSSAPATVESKQNKTKDSHISLPCLCFLFSLIFTGNAATATVLSDQNEEYGLSNTHSVNRFGETEQQARRIALLTDIHMESTQRRNEYKKGSQESLDFFRNTGLSQRKGWSPIVTP